MIVAMIVAMMIMMMIMIMTVVESSSSLDIVTSAETLVSSVIVNKTCMSNVKYEGSNQCTHPKSCGRYVLDDFVDADDVNRLRDIAQKGLDFRNGKGVESTPAAGPTIIDINTGYIRDSNGLINAFTNDNNIYDVADFDHYGRIIKKLKIKVEEVFGIQDVYFTAPTFITHIRGAEDWEPQSIHDEYWHLHVDNNNTEHYHYSGLLYLSTINKDFTGGRLKFFNSDEVTLEQVIEPKAARLLVFSSGRENPHLFERVTTGSRMVLAFWFTCNQKKQFEMFLDGKAHVTFAAKMKKGLRQKEL